MNQKQRTELRQLAQTLDAVTSDAAPTDAHDALLEGALSTLEAITAEEWRKRDSFPRAFRDRGAGHGIRVALANLELAAGHLRAGRLQEARREIGLAINPAPRPISGT